MNDDSIPNELQELDQWICWREETRDGEPTKVPIDPHTGSYASSTDSDTWGTFDQAREFHSSNDTQGVGFVFDSEGTIVGVDLDDVRNPETGKPTDQAKEIINSLDSWTEVSPSGTGYHVFAHGFVPDGGNRGDIDDVSHLEIYDQSRFFTVTGDHVSGTPETIENRADTLRGIHREYVADEPEESNSGQSVPSNRTDVSLEDSELLEKAKNADNGDEFTRLWNGDTSMHSNDHSRADLALCGHLAFYTGGDRNRIDRLFRRSGLMRNKWDEDRGSQTYGERTIDKALDGRTEFYNPAKTKAVGDGGITTAETASSTGPGHKPLENAIGPGWFDLSLKTVRVQQTADYSVEELTDLFQNPSELPKGAKQAVMDTSGGSEWLFNTDEWKVEAPVSDEYSYQGVGFEEMDTRGLKQVALENLPAHRVAYIPEREAWFWCNESNIWQPHGEESLRQWLDGFFGPFYSQHLRNEVMDQLKARVRRDETTFGGGPAGTIATDSGLVDIDSCELKGQVQPEHFARWSLNTEFDPEADCPGWKEFLGSVAEPSDIPLLQEYIGYTLAHWELPFKKALIMLGPTDAGKSVFLDVIRELFGGDESAATSSTSLQYLANERWGPSRLVNTALNIRNDLDEHTIKNTGKVKEIVGGDTLDAEYKRKPVFQFSPVAKHIFAANRAPDRSTDDEAFWNRWLTVVFPESVSQSEQNPNLTDELIEELPGILNWAIEGYQRLMEQGRFTDEPEPWQNREKWERYGNSIEQWLDRYTETDEGNFTPKRTVGDETGAYDSYKAFARKNNLEIESDRKFTGELKRKPELSKTQRTVNGKRPRGFANLKLTDDAPEPEFDTDGDDSDDGDDGHNAGLDGFDRDDDPDEQSSGEDSSTSDSESGSTESNSGGSDGEGPTTEPDSDGSTNGGDSSGWGQLLADIENHYSAGDEITPVDIVNRVDRIGSQSYAETGLEELANQGLLSRDGEVYLK